MHTNLPYVQKDNKRLSLDESYKSISCRNGHMNVYNDFQNKTDPFRNDWIIRKDMYEDAFDTYICSYHPGLNSQVDKVELIKSLNKLVKKIGSSCASDWVLRQCLRDHKFSDSIIDDAIANVQESIRLKARSKSYENNDMVDTFAYVDITTRNETKDWFTEDFKKSIATADAAIKRAIGPNVVESLYKSETYKFTPEVRKEYERVKAMIESIPPKCTITKEEAKNILEEPLIPTHRNSGKRFLKSEHHAENLRKTKYGKCIERDPHNIKFGKNGEKTDRGWSLLKVAMCTSIGLFWCIVSLYIAKYGLHGGIGRLFNWN